MKNEKEKDYDNDKTSRKFRHDIVKNVYFFQNYHKLL